jgi:histidinol-phosphatase (PHP family)
LLTDYHLHLRPDEDGTEPERYFTRENYERYRAAASERGIEELGVAEHVHRFARALEVWQHPFWRLWAVDDLEEYVEFVRGTDLRLGIEADYVPEREDRMANLLDAYEWDYVVGSIHFIRDEAIDQRGEWDVWRTSGDTDKVWTAYFDALGEAARTGMFDVLAHPDLVKVWGDRVPEGDLRRFYDRAMDGIAESDVAIEVSTAGLRKPVGELYPDRAFLEMCLEAGKPVALSSDAHLPEQVGYEYGRAVEWLAEAGVTEIAVFERRTRRLEAIG